MPEKIRVSTMDSLRLFMDEEAVADTEAAYMEDGDLYVLDPHVDKETREKLNEDFGKPMLILAGLTEGGEETEGNAFRDGAPEGTDPLQAIAQMPEEARDQMTSAMEEQIGEMPESIVTQAAVSFVGQSMKPSARMLTPFRWIISYPRVSA